MQRTPVDFQSHRSRGRSSCHGVRWLSWFLGAALLVAVVVAAIHFSEERAFVRLVERAEPWWLVVAVLLQAGTYLAQGGIWRRVGAAAGCPLSRKTAFELGSRGFGRRSTSLRARTPGSCAVLAC